MSENETLKRFVNKYKVDEAEAEKFSKLNRLVDICFALAFLSFFLLVSISLIYLFSTRSQRPENEITPVEIGGIGIPILISGLFIVFAFIFIRKIHSLEISENDWIRHQIAVSIEMFNNSEYTSSIDKLKDIQYSSPQIFRHIPMFPKLPTSSLSWTTNWAIQKYIEKIQNSNDSESNIEDTYENFITLVVKEITAVENREYYSVLNRVNEPEVSKVGYKSLVIDSITPSGQTIRKLSFLIVITLITGIGFGIFILIDDTLGMLVTVALFTSYQIYVTRG